MTELHYHILHGAKIHNLPEFSNVIQNAITIPYCWFWTFQEPVGVKRLEYEDWGISATIECQIEKVLCWKWP